MVSRVPPRLGTAMTRLPAPASGESCSTPPATRATPRSSACAGGSPADENSSDRCASAPAAAELGAAHRTDEPSARSVAATDAAPKRQRMTPLVLSAAELSEMLMAAPPV